MVSTLSLLTWLFFWTSTSYELWGGFHPPQIKIYIFRTLPNVYLEHCTFFGSQIAPLNLKGRGVDSIPPKLKRIYLGHFQMCTWSIVHSNLSYLNTIAPVCKISSKLRVRINTQYAGLSIHIYIWGGGVSPLMGPKGYFCLCLCSRRVLKVCVGGGW